MKKLRILFVLLVTVGLFVSFGACAQAKAKTTTVKLGIIGDDTDVWDTVKKRVKKAGIDLVYVKFSDYNQPNQALSDGSIDLNAFQHKIFLENYNQHHHTTLVSIGNTENAPMGIYSEKVTALSQLKTGSKLAIPNDVTNGGRAYYCYKQPASFNWALQKTKRQPLLIFVKTRKNFVLRS